MSRGVSPTGSGSGGSDGHTQSCSCGGAIGSTGAEDATDYTVNATSTRHGTSTELYSHAGIGLHERSSVARRRVHFAPLPEPEPRPRPSHAIAPMVAMEVDHREPPPDRSSHDSAAAADDHRTMDIRPIDVRSSHLTRDEADDFLGAHQRAGTRLSRVRPRRQRWTNMVRDRGDHLWELPRFLVGLERVGYRNGIHSFLTPFHCRCIQHCAFGGLRQLVSDRRALIRVCLAHRLPMRAVDIITFMAFPVRGTSLPLQR